MPSYRNDGSGGYVIRRDDGTEFRSAIPVGSPESSGAVMPTGGPDPNADKIQGSLFGPGGAAALPQGAPLQLTSQYGRDLSPVEVAAANQTQPIRTQGSAEDKIRNALGAGQGSNLFASPSGDPRLLLAKEEATQGQPGRQAGIFATPQPAAPKPGQLPPGYYTTKAGYIPRGKSEQVREIPEEQQKQIDYAFQSQAAAQQYGAAVGIQKANEEYATKQAYADQIRALDAQNIMREQQRQQMVQDQMNKVQRTADDVAAQKIDRNHIWESGGRDAAAVALAIGAFVQARGGPNTIAPMINKAVDDDIKDQEMNLQNKKEGLAAQNNILSRMREQFGDERAAYLAAKAVKIDDLSRQIELTAARYKAPEVTAQAQASVADLRKQYAGLMTELNQRVESISYAYDPGGLHGPAAPKVKEEDVKHLDTELRKEHLPQAYSTIDDMSRILDKSKGEDVAGLGKGTDWAVEHVPGARSFLSDEGNQNRQAVDKLVLAVAHATGRVTPAEVETVRNTVLGDGSARSIRNGLAWAKKELQNVDRSVRASVPTAAQDEYLRRGGLPMPSYAGATQVRPAGSE